VSIKPSNEEFNSPQILELILYVDDDFNESTPGWDVDHFSSIQDAVDKAINGDTIFVYNGTYHENVFIDKDIDLIGEDKSSTIIDGSNTGRVVSFTKNGVYLSGFTIKNSGNYVEESGIYVESYTNTIENNIIFDCQNGIYLKDSNSNEILENTINNCNYGIYLINSDFNTIKQNIFDDHKYGIYIQESSSNDINSNFIQDNEDGIWFKIDCNDNTIAGNTIRRNTNRGIFIDRFCFNNILHHNNFLDNNDHARFKMSFLNTWEYNYWDNWIGLEVEEYRIFPKLILGRILGPIPWINFDQYPLYEPHLIEPS
jgi:parallel beta-helix repeat protein